MRKLRRCPSISDLAMYFSTLSHPQFQHHAFYTLQPSLLHEVTYIFGGNRYSFNDVCLGGKM